MKEIYLAKKSKRMLARLIDFLIILILSCVIFFPLIFPAAFNSNEFEQNSNEIINLYKDSSLFLVDEQGNYSGKSAAASFDTINDLYLKENVTFNNVKENISLTESLESFYLTKYQEYGGNLNLTISSYESEILKVGSEESNINSYDIINHTFILHDESKSTTTLNYFLNIYENTCKFVISNSKISELTSNNQKLVLYSLLYFIPVICGFSLIFDLIIPLCNTYGQSIGKMIFKLGIISSEGYILKKYYLIPRQLTYIILEVILGIASFGGTFLITYTMFLFTKKRRCIHDYLSNSVVIDLTRSIIFKNQKEENYYLNRMIEKGKLNEKKN